MGKSNGTTRASSKNSPKGLAVVPTISQYLKINTAQDFANLIRGDAFPRGRTLSIGTIRAEIKKDYEAKGLSLETEDVVISDSTILKYISHKKEAKGAIIDKGRYNEVMAVIKNPEHIYEDTAQHDIVYVSTNRYEPGKVLKVVIHPNFKKKGETYNLAKSIGVVNTEDMLGKQYRKIK